MSITGPKKTLHNYDENQVFAQALHYVRLTVCPFLRILSQLPLLIGA